VELEYGARPRRLGRFSARTLYRPQTSSVAPCVSVVCSAIGNWVCRIASRVWIASELLGQVKHYRRLVKLGAVQIDVSALPPARRRALESLGRRMTAQQLRRLEPVRRHPPMLVLLHALVIP